MKQSEQIDKLSAAFVAFQSEVVNPTLDETADVPTKSGGKFSYDYASLATVLAFIRPTLAKHHLGVMQWPGRGEKGPTLTTRLIHASGQWLEGEPLEVPAPKADAQGFGSAITYMRRYALLALAGVVGEHDDDGQAACRQAAPAKQEPAASPLYMTIVRTEQKMIEDSLCLKGALRAHLRQLLADKQPGPIEQWPESLREVVVQATQAFARKLRGDRQPAGNGQGAK
jgi:hypothetical protein